MRSHAVVTALVLLAIRVTPVRGQELSAETLQAINTASGARVRLADPGWHRLAGTGRVGSDNTLVYLRGGHPGPSLTEVSLRDVREVQVARGTNAGKGAFIGGAVGLGLTIVAVIIASGDDWTTPTAGQAVAAMLVNTAAGAGTGALVGCASTRWRTVYRAEAP